jgi:heat-inducible transcriptional repressor
MRVLSSAEQEDRKRRLLQAVIHQYIKTGKPVGSTFIAEQSHLDLSSATIRNVMAELEQEGYLTHPHTSAGRVPTDKAYRYYVDSLIELQRLAQMEEERIHRDYEARIREIEELMLSTSKTLSALSHYTGFVLSPSLEQAQLRHLELIPLDSRRVLVVLVSDSGVVKHRVVAFETSYPMDLIGPLSRMLNEKLRGCPFAQVRESLLDHIEDASQKQIDLFNLARRITRQAFDISDEGEIYLEGTGNILSLPDFQNQEQMRSLVHLLDEKRALGELLAKDLTDGPGEKKWPGVHVKIGAEMNYPDLRNLSLISATYTIKGRTVGVLGILGPKRMEYSRMISLVNSVSKAVSHVLSKLVGG